MKEKFTFLTRINLKFIPVPITKNVPSQLPGAGSYYVRFTEDGKRYCKPLGKDLRTAFVDFYNLEVAREHVKRGMPVPVAMMPVPLAPHRSAASLHVSVEKYLEDTRNTKDEKTFKSYRQTLRVFADSQPRPEVIASIQNVTCEDVKAFVAWQKKEGYSPGTIRTRFVALQIFLKTLNANPEMRKTDKPKKFERTPESFHEGELKAFRAVATPEELLLMDCFLNTGMRSQEIAHLTYADIDFRTSRWSVRPKADWKIKHEAKERAVPVDFGLTVRIKARMEALLAKGSDYIFTSTVGRARPNSSLLRVIKLVAARAKITGIRVDDHKFRATAITRWLKAGIPVPIVMVYVGHKHPMTIMRYFDKLAAEDEAFNAKATSAFSSVMDAVQPTA